MSDLEQSVAGMKNRCPLCGGENHCAVTLAMPIEDCWCKVQNIPDGLLQKLPAELRNKQCICQACVREYIQADN